MFAHDETLVTPSDIGQKENFSISFPSIPFLSISTPTCKQMGDSNAHTRDIPSPTQLFLRMAASRSSVCPSFQLTLQMGRRWAAVPGKLG